MSKWIRSMARGVATFTIVHRPSYTIDDRQTDSDLEALVGDWHRVGNDIKVSMNKAEPEINSGRIRKAMNG